jgi:hypothetical protein
MGAHALESEVIVMSKVTAVVIIVIVAVISVVLSILIQRMPR